MGCFPEYLQLAGQCSVNALAVPERMWRVMTGTGEAWTMLSAFWRTTARRKLGILLATNPGLVSTSSLYAMEIEFLRKLGYAPNRAGTRLDFGGEAKTAPGSAPSISPRATVGGFLRKLLPNASPQARMRKALTPRGTDPALEETVRKSLHFLFRDSSTAIVSNYRFPAAFGNAAVTMAASTLLVRVIRDRDELRTLLQRMHPRGGSCSAWHRPRSNRTCRIWLLFPHSPSTKPPPCWRQRLHLYSRPFRRKPIPRRAALCKKLNLPSCASGSIGLSGPLR